MNEPRVISCRERIPGRKSLEGSDGYVYTLEMPDGQTQRVVLFGFIEDLFKTNAEPIVRTVSPSYITALTEKAAKKHVALFDVDDRIARMDKTPPWKYGAFASDDVTPEVISALNEFEREKAASHTTRPDFMRVNEPVRPECEESAAIITATIMEPG